MSDKIDNEINEIAEKIEKSQIDPKESLIATIKELGAEGIRAKLPTLAKSEQELLLSTLEEMKKAKPVSMDDVYETPYHKGNINDTVIQEEVADDDADEKLVKPEAAKMKNQGDNSPEGIDGQVIKSELDELTDEDFDTLHKSFGEDYDVMDDFFYSDDSDFQDDLLEKGAKTTTRGGIRYYAEGPNAGKKVGTIRGDKASINSIARAQKKGKISASGSKKAVGKVQSIDKYAKQKSSAQVSDSSISGKSDEDIKRNARRKMGDKKYHYREGSETKASHDKITNDMVQAVKPLTEAREKRKKEIKRKKDGSAANTAGNRKLDQAVVDAREATAEGKSKARRAMDEHIKNSNDTRKEYQKKLKAKREKMNKSELILEIKEALIKSYEEAGVEYTTEELKAGIREIALDQFSKSVVAEVSNPEEDQVEDCLDDLQKESTRGDKSKPEELKTAEDSKKAQDNVDKMEVKKSVVWNSEDALLKANTGGRNHNFSVNSYYDELVEKSQKTTEEETLVKSSKEDINDVIEKGQDISSDELLCKSMLEENASKINGKLVKSFADNEIVQALGLSEEEAKQILGE